MKKKKKSKNRDNRDVVEKILEFNIQNYTGQGLKIHQIPDQILSRLANTLAQLKA